MPTANTKIREYAGFLRGYEGTRRASVFLHGVGMDADGHLSSVVARYTSCGGLQSYGRTSCNHALSTIIPALPQMLDANMVDHLVDISRLESVLMVGNGSQPSPTPVRAP